MQELIAPVFAYFFDRNWRYIGTKHELCDSITAITGISKAVLINADDCAMISVAQKISWAAKRNTTREEDQLYCLFEIFSINLPLLYGEGGKAFTRLQEAIIRTTNDLSLFAWQSDARNNMEDARGVLARSPGEFALSGNIIFPQLSDPNPKFALTDIGLEIKVSARSGPGPFFISATQLLSGYLSRHRARNLDYEIRWKYILSAPIGESH